MLRDLKSTLGSDRSDSIRFVVQYLYVFSAGLLGLQCTVYSQRSASICRTKDAKDPRTWESGWVESLKMGLCLDPLDDAKDETFSLGHRVELAHIVG